LVDGFKGHSRDVVKEFVGQFKSTETWSSASSGVVSNSRYPCLCAFEMAGGITPKAQSYDAIVDKVFKGYYREFYDLNMLDAPLNSKGYPISPSHQLCAKWCAQAWNKVPEELILKKNMEANRRNNETDGMIKIN
jgi:hypothetical protein